MENLKELNLQTLDNSELESVEGGTPLVGAVARWWIIVRWFNSGNSRSLRYLLFLDKAVTR
jgi:hypothetical protein